MEQNSLFYNQMNEPLAARLRPQSLDEIIGQQHLIGEGKVLRRMVESDRIPSMIFWGPPGVGKTTLASVIAKTTRANFINFSAVTSGIKEIKEVMKRAEEDTKMGERTIVFVDEIHRFNKAQQDAFLPFVEKGAIILIGATTENPSFEVNGALLSRCKVFVLKQLSAEDIVVLLKRAIEDPRSFEGKKIEIDEEDLFFIANFSNGDARMALSTLEMAVLNGWESQDKIAVDKGIIEEITSKKSLLYDKKGEEHYNIISALHKSMRNSDPDAAVYWLARMLEAGEDPLYVARRVIRFASEDVGIADPNAMQLALSACQVYERMGSPEGDLALTELVIYLGTAPKSVSVDRAKMASYAVAKQTSNLMPPKNILNAPTRMMKEMGYGRGYVYDPDTESGCSGQNCFPESMSRQSFYHPIERGFEREIKKRLEYWNTLRARANKDSSE